MRQTFIYRKVRGFILEALYEFPFTSAWAYRRLPKHKSDYKDFWGKGGKSVHDLKSGGFQETLPRKYISPTLHFLVGRLHDLGATTVLDAGCGIGRQMNELKSLIEISGFDYSQEYVDMCRKEGLDVFQFDLIHPEPTRTWNVSYTMLVMCFFIDKPDQMYTAMQSLDRMTDKKILIWEWRHVCDYMRSIYPSDKFEYHPLPIAW